jgi:hypothetical protein
MSKLIVNVSTGETVERELNDKEITQQELDEAYIKARQDKLDKKEQKETEEKTIARQAILDRLGLTTDDLRALGL